MPPDADRNAGFTLVELIAMIVMIGIVSVVVAPRLASLSDYETRGVHDKLVAHLQYARQAAIASRRHVCVNFSNGLGGKLSFGIATTQPEAMTGTCDLSFNPPIPDKTTGCAANEVCAGSRVELSASQSAFQFDAQGRLSPATAVTIAVTGESSITIEAESGYVR